MASNDLQSTRDQNRKLHEDFLASLGIYKNKNDPHQKAVKNRKEIEEEIFQPITYSHREYVMESLSNMWPCRERHLLSLVNHLSPFSLIASSPYGQNDFKTESPLLLQGPAGTGKKGLLRGVLHSCNIRHIWVHCDKLLPPCEPGRTEYSINQLSSIIFSDILQQICDKYSASYSVKKEQRQTNNGSVSLSDDLTIGSDVGDSGGGLSEHNDDTVSCIPLHDLEKGGELRGEEESVKKRSVHHRKQTQLNSTNHLPNKKDKRAFSSNKASSSYASNDRASSCKDIHSFIYALHKLLPPLVTKGHLSTLDSLQQEQQSEDSGYSQYFQETVAQENNDFDHNIMTSTNTTTPSFQLVHDFEMDQDVKDRREDIESLDVLSSHFAPNFVIVFSQAERLYDHDVIHASEALLPQLGMTNQLLHHFQTAARKRIIKKLLKKSKPSIDNHDWLSRTSQSTSRATSSSSGKVGSGGDGDGGGGGGSGGTLYGCSWMLKLVFTVSERLHIESSKLKNGRLIGQVPISIAFSSYTKEELRPILISEVMRMNRRSNPISITNDRHQDQVHLNTDKNLDKDEEVGVIVDHLLNAAYGVSNVRVLRRAVLLVLESAKLHNIQIIKKSTFHHETKSDSSSSSSISSAPIAHAGTGRISLSKLVDKAIQSMHKPDFSSSHLIMAEVDASHVTNASSVDTTLNKMVNLPPRMKFLIIAAFIAGVTTSENDVKKFTPGEQGKRKRSRHSERNDSEQPSKGASSSGQAPKGIFALQRLLAIFGFMQEDFGETLNENTSKSSQTHKRRYLYSDSYSGSTMVQVAELINLSLLEKNQTSKMSSTVRNSSAAGKSSKTIPLSSSLLSEPSFRSLVPRDLAYFLAGQLGVTLEKYLA